MEWQGAGAGRTHTVLLKNLTLTKLRSKKSLTRVHMKINENPSLVKNARNNLLNNKNILLLIFVTVCACCSLTCC